MAQDGACGRREAGDARPGAKGGEPKPEDQAPQGAGAGRKAYKNVQKPTKSYTNLQKHTQNHETNPQIIHKNI